MQRKTPLATLCVDRKKMGKCWSVCGCCEVSDFDDSIQEEERVEKNEDPFPFSSVYFYAPLENDTKRETKSSFATPGH